MKSISSVKYFKNSKISAKRFFSILTIILQKNIDIFTTNFFETDYHKHTSLGKMSIRNNVYL